MFRCLGATRSNPMIRYALSAAFGLLMCAVVVLAGDISGVITKVDYDSGKTDSGTITVKGDNDKETTVKFNSKTKFVAKKKGEESEIAVGDVGKNKAVASGKAKGKITFDGDK